MRELGAPGTQKGRGEISVVPLLKGPGRVRRGGIGEKQVSQLRLL